MNLIILIELITDTFFKSSVSISIFLKKEIDIFVAMTTPLRQSVRDIESLVHKINMSRFLFFFEKFAFAMAKNADGAPPSTHSALLILLVTPQTLFSSLSGRSLSFRYF